MRKFFTWLALLSKRQLKSPLFIAILVLIPAAAAVASSIPALNDGSSITAGVYADGGEASAELAENLVKYEGSFDFVKYDDLDAMYRDVKNSKLNCGYVFPKDLSERAGTPSDGILVLHCPSNTIQASVNEVVYAELLRIQGRGIITEHVRALGLFAESDTDYTDELLRLYDRYLNGNATFKLAYHTYGAGGLTKKDITESSVSFPVRGILSVMVFLAALFGGVTWLRDGEKGIFATLTGSYGSLCKILYILIPTVFFGAASLLTLSLLGLYVSSAELTAMLALVLLSCLFSLLMTAITRQSRTFSACIPVILLGCLIFCNIFINASSYVPAARFVEKLFVPYYYLSFFS
ncbi:MAG: hypothetical protein NC223_05430 [Butyrivibrio sp.]|nr:hypothetical protein [Butyrivibrio sp.]